MGNASLRVVVAETSEAGLAPWSVQTSTIHGVTGRFA